MAVKETVKLLQKSEQFIRIGLQMGILSFGFAVKMSSRWTYHISDARMFSTYSGKGVNNAV